MFDFVCLFIICFFGFNTAELGWRCHKSIYMMQTNDKGCVTWNIYIYDIPVSTHWWVAILSNSFILFYTHLRSMILPSSRGVTVQLAAPSRPVPRRWRCHVLREPPGVCYTPRRHIVSNKAPLQRHYWKWGKRPWHQRRPVQGDCRIAALGLLGFLVLMPLWWIWHADVTVGFILWWWRHLMNLMKPQRRFVVNMGFGRLMCMLIILCIVEILLMEEILRSPVEVGSLSHCFVHPRWLFGISSINRIFSWESKGDTPKCHQPQRNPTLKRPQKKGQWWLIVP